MHFNLTEFTRAFAIINGLDIARWRFEPGMRHADTIAWWGLKAPRKHVHHGIDFAVYENSDGTVRQLEAGVRVPLPASALIAAIIKDFLGYTVVAVHEEHGGRQLIGLYGHVIPVAEILGIRCQAGSIIGELAHPRMSTAPPHLHLGMALVPKGTDLESLSWNYLSSSSDVEHLDPMEML